MGPPSEELFSVGPGGNSGMVETPAGAKGLSELWMVDPVMARLLLAEEYTELLDPVLLKKEVFKTSYQYQNVKTRSG